jgi:TRAP transporter TAXI family solute receptor
MKKVLVTLVLVMIFMFMNAPQAHSAAYPKEWPRQITITAGIMGGPWYPLMIKVSEVLMREIDGINVNVIEGGSLENCRLVQKGEDAQIGLAYANILVAALEGQYDNAKMTNLSATNAFLTSYVSFVVPVGSSIQKVEDMFDKRIGTSTVGGGPDLIWNSVLEFYGRSYDDIRKAGGSVSMISYSEQATLMKDQHLDVGLFAGDSPHSSAKELDVSRPIRVIEFPSELITELNKKFPYLAMGTIKAGTYSGVKEDVKTLTIPGVLIVNKKALPEDMVYRILSVIMDNAGEIINTYSYVDLLNYEDYKIGIDDWYWHPAAKKLYEEHVKK